MKLMSLAMAIKGGRRFMEGILYISKENVAGERAKRAIKTGILKHAGKTGKGRIDYC